MIARFQMSGRERLDEFVRVRSRDAGSLLGGALVVFITGFILGAILPAYLGYFVLKASTPVQAERPARPVPCSLCGIESMGTHAEHADWGY